MKQLLILLVAIMTIAGFTSVASAQCSGEGGTCTVELGPVVASDPVPPGDVVIYTTTEFYCHYCERWKRVEAPKLIGWRIVERQAKPGERVPYFRVRTGSGRKVTLHGYQPASAFTGLR